MSGFWAMSRIWAGPSVTSVMLMGRAILGGGAVPLRPRGLTTRTATIGIDRIRSAGQNHASLSEDTSTSEAPPVRQLSALELKALIEAGTSFEFVDVRTEWERSLAKIDGSHLLDQSHHDTLLRLDRSAPIVFLCHHGIRSQQAAEYFRREGFRDLCNVQGGIDAWSQLVDPSVPRY